MGDDAYRLGGDKHLFADWMLVEPGYGVAWAARPGRGRCPTA